MTKVPVIKYMFRSDWKVLTDALHSGTVFESESFELASDLSTFLSGTNFGLVIASLKSKNDLIQLAGLVKSFKKNPGTFIKIIVINFSGNKQFEKAVAKLDLDLLEENIQPKALRFKIDFMMKSINAQMKKVAHSTPSNNVKSLQENSKTQDKKIVESAPLWTEALDCEDDIWLLRNEVDCKKILTRWLVRLIGPSPYVASWVDSGTPGVWKFEFKNEKSIFISGKGSWFYRGDQKPDFVWAENVWSFTGSSFDLFYKEGNTTFHRINLKDKLLAIAKTSQYAKTKERSIIESFDKDLVFKKEIQSNGENKSFEIEQNKFKNLEGKNKTENIDQGPLSGKGKTESLDQSPLSGKNKTDDSDHGPLSGKNKTETLNQGPLSGKNKTSNINTEPLSGDVKPEESNKSQEPLSEKTSTNKSSSFWKGKNEYENQSKGNIDAPSSQELNPGAELALETTTGHEKFYKNHNEAEKFAAKELNHSIQKDGVSENLKGKTDPTKSSSNTGGKDLGGKSSTDQMDGHLTSPNARKEKINGEMSENELSGKTTTDKIQGHLSSNAKKEIFRRNASSKTNAENEKPESDGLEKELNGAADSLETNNDKKEKEKSSTQKMVSQLAALRLKKEELEKEKEAKAVSEELQNQTGRPKDGVVEKISTTYSSKSKPKELNAKEEKADNVLPFAEKEKNSHESESLGSKELDNAVLSAQVTSLLIQDGIRITCNLDDYYDQTIIFNTNQSGIQNSKSIVLDLNFLYMNKSTNLKFNGKVLAIEDGGDGTNYISVQISSDNASDFNAFMKLYNTRQENINFFLNAAKG